MSDKAITLRQLIDNGLLENTSQIDVGEAEIGTCFLIQEDSNGKECLYVSCDDETFSFELDQTVEINGLAVISTEARGLKWELYFKKQIDLDPDAYVNNIPFKNDADRVNRPPLKNQLDFITTQKEAIDKLMQVLEKNRFAQFYSDSGLFGRYVSGDLEHEEKLTYEQATEKVRAELSMMLFPKT